MYQRPAIREQTFVDADGTPIPYGHRWDGSPPDDAYSRTSHTERFRPLHDVADALLEWLIATFEVTVSHPPGTSASATVERAVRLTPASATAAPLTVELTSFPGVFVQAGALAGGAFPPCGCDACDEDLVSTVDGLEQFVFAVVRGRFAERVGTQSPQWVECDLRYDDGSSSGGGLRDDLSAEQLEEARAALPPGGAWDPWTLRARRRLTDSP